MYTELYASFVARHTGWRNWAKISCRLFFRIDMIVATGRSFDFFFVVSCYNLQGTRLLVINLTQFISGNIPTTFTTEKEHFLWSVEQVLRHWSRRKWRFKKSWHEVITKSSPGKQFKKCFRSKHNKKKQQLQLSNKNFLLSSNTWRFVLDVIIERFRFQRYETTSTRFSQY